MESRTEALAKYLCSRHRGSWKDYPNLQPLFIAMASVLPHASSPEELSDLYRTTCLLQNLHDITVHTNYISKSQREELINFFKYYHEFNSTRDSQPITG